jgi:hypothetical protein
MTYPKVKITREQERAATIYKEVRLNKRCKNLLESFCDERHTWDSAFKPIANFDVPEFALILAGHYEVINDFKVGDWVYHLKYDMYMKVEPNDVETSTIKYISLRFVNDNPDRFTKVENPLEIKLLEAGRKVPKLLEGDVILDGDGVAYSVEKDSSVNDYDYDYIVAIYPAESKITT